MLYLDYAATTPVNEQVLTTYTELLAKYYGNPDSIHPVGMEASGLMKQSRDQIASLLHVSANEIIYTSGASESNNMAIKGIAWQYQQRGKHIITSNAEHASVKKACEQLEELFGFEVTYLPVNDKGIISLDQVQQAMRPDTILVSLIFVNNEIGSINPVATIGSWLKKHHPRVAIHSDLVQAVGKLPLPMEYLDLATISAHKIHGLKGSGILIKKEPYILQSLSSGGEQEFGLRAGTSNAPVNIVMAKTLRLALEGKDQHFAQAAVLRKVLMKQLQHRSDIVFNSTMEGSPFIMNLRTPLGSEVMMNALASQGYCVSARSTCATKYVKPSHVLTAIGLSSEAANHSIRVSIDSMVTSQQMMEFARVLMDTVDRFRI